jgi:hypothetical protein
MSEWWTYRPSDFLLFSPQTFYRLFELYNIDIWPMQILALTLGLVIPVLVWRNPPWQGRAITVILAACWLWVAWAYHLQRYATINWAASYFASAFAFEAVLLFWLGVIRGKLEFRPSIPSLNRTGLGIYYFALIAQPFIAPLAGRQWVQAEVFGITPDPTVIATLGLLLLAGNKTYWTLFIIPILWCAISGAILGTMESPDALLMPLTALLVLLFALRKTFWHAKR